jgi:hypothetical protein
MAQKNIRKKGLLLRALEDGMLKAIELSAAGIVIGLEPQVILVSSTAVFAGSLAYKAVMLKVSENSEKKRVQVLRR